MRARTISEVAQGAELQGHLHADFPGEAERKLKNRIIMEDKFAGIKDIVDAINVESYVVTVSDYAKFSQVLYRVCLFVCLFHGIPEVCDGGWTLRYLKAGRGGPLCALEADPSLCRMPGEFVV